MRALRNHLTFGNLVDKRTCRQTKNTTMSTFFYICVISRLIPNCIQLFLNLIKTTVNKKLLSVFLQRRPKDGKRKAYGYKPGSGYKT